MRIGKTNICIHLLWVYGAVMHELTAGAPTQTQTAVGTNTMCTVIAEIYVHNLTVSYGHPAQGLSLWPSDVAHTAAAVKC